MKKCLVLTLVILTALISFAATKNVIFFIGDGMGLSTTDLARIFFAGKDGYLDYEKAPYVGLQKTYCSTTLVTDSAAAGTALATGYKTNYEWLSITPDNKDVKTLVEAAKEKGKATGIVTTVTVTHATPAAFGSHTTSRDELPVADYYNATKTADLYMGGGLQYFVPNSDPKSRRKDSKNLVEDFKNSGYQFVSNLDELNKADSNKILGLFNTKELPNYLDRLYSKESYPTLADMVKKSLDVLSKDPDGFFVMFEAGKIDWRNHGHDAAGAIWEVYELNEAVKAALEFLKNNPDTLIIVTGDHETGGLSLGNGKYEFSPEALKSVKVTTEEIVRQVKGKSDDEVKKIFSDLTGIVLFDPTELEAVKSGNATKIADVIDKRAQLAYTTEKHSGVSLPVYAFGKGAENFAGVYENYDIARKIAALAGYNLTVK